MALVRIKDATVTRLNSKGFGVKVTESNEHDGKTYKTSFTLWFKEDSGLTVGEVVSVSGFLSAKVGAPWTDNDGHERVSVELSLNYPKVDGERKPAEEWADEQAAQTTDWSAPGSFNDETPF